MKILEQSNGVLKASCGTGLNTTIVSMTLIKTGFRVGYTPAIGSGFYEVIQCRNQAYTRFKSLCIQKSD